MDTITQLTTPCISACARARENSSSSLVGELVEQHPHDLDLHLQALDVGRGVLEQLAEPARLAAGRHQPPQLPHLLHQPSVLQDLPLADRRHRRLAPTISSHPPPAPPLLPAAETGGTRTIESRLAMS